jgi:26S proteasome regulatory subunit T1
MHAFHCCVVPLLLLLSGTGKTLLARAVANRTDACFIRVIGSELVQKYVGEVSSRRRKIEASQAAHACC